MKAHINSGLCEGNGLCEFYAPAVFSLDDHGTVCYRVDVPPGQVEAVEIAEQMCPQRAIEIRR
jgi:ferredoxin